MSHSISAILLLFLSLSPLSSSAMERLSASPRGEQRITVPLSSLIFLGSGSAVGDLAKENYELRCTQFKEKLKNGLGDKLTYASCGSSSVISKDSYFDRSYLFQKDMSRFRLYGVTEYTRVTSKALAVINFPSDTGIKKLEKPLHTDWMPFSSVGFPTGTVFQLLFEKAQTIIEPSSPSTLFSELNKKYEVVCEEFTEEVEEQFSDKLVLSTCETPNESRKLELTFRQNGAKQYAFIRMVSTARIYYFSDIQ